MHDRRHGCATHFVNYTAKHWGHSAVRWQSTCPSCGRKQQRNTGHIISTHDTKAQAAAVANHLNCKAQAEKHKARLTTEWHTSGRFDWDEWEQWCFMLHDGDLDAEDYIMSAFYGWQQIEGLTEEMFLPFLEEYLTAKTPNWWPPSADISPR